MNRARRHAALILAGVLGAMVAPPLSAQYTQQAPGRLFTTPDERLRLDRDRIRAPVAVIDPLPATPATAVEAAPPPPPPVPARLTGVVRRSDGRATVWIDDIPRETTLPRLRPGSAIPVDTPAGRVLVKPGQSYDPADGAPADLP